MPERGLAFGLKFVRVHTDVLLRAAELKCQELEKTPADTPPPKTTFSGRTEASCRDFPEFFSSRAEQMARCDTPE